MQWVHTAYSAALFWLQKVMGNLGAPHEVVYEEYIIAKEDPIPDCVHP